MLRPLPIGLLVQAYAVMHADESGILLRDIRFRGALPAVLDAIREIPGDYRIRSLHREGHLVRGHIQRAMDLGDGAHAWTRCGTIRVVLGLPEVARPLPLRRPLLVHAEELRWPEVVSRGVRR